MTSAALTSTGPAFRSRNACNTAEFFQADGHNTFSELYYAAMALSPGALLIAVLSLAVLLLWERPAFKRSRALVMIPGPLVVVERQ